jgi:general secretion pathway protein A
MSDADHPDTIRDELLPPRESATPVEPTAAPSASAGVLPLYAAYFRLRREPFSIAPDPRCLYMSERHREALAHLLFGVRSGGGFVLLTGEIGAGKTTVCRCFLEQIPADVNVAYVLNPKQSVQELLESVCQEFRIEAPAPVPGVGVKPFVDALNRYLLEQHAAGRSNVLIIDEAQNLSLDVLEQLRLLTNLETAERKLLQIMLIGQPELRDMLAQPALEQLEQRVIARYHLRALSQDETVRYVHHRLAVAGAVAQGLFDERALALIHEVSRGVPRRINLLCDRALLGSYAKGKPRIDTEIVERAAAEVFGKPAPSVLRRRGQLARRQMLTLVVAGVLIGLAAAAFAAWWVSRGPVPGTEAPPSPAAPASSAVAQP